MAISGYFYAVLIPLSMWNRFLPRGLFCTYNSLNPTVCSNLPKKIILDFYFSASFYCGLIWHKFAIVLIHSLASFYVIFDWSWRYQSFFPFQNSAQLKTHNFTKYCFLLCWKFFQKKNNESQLFIFQCEFIHSFSLNNTWWWIT